MVQTVRYNKMEPDKDKRRETKKKSYWKHREKALIRMRKYAEKNRENRRIEGIEYSHNHLVERRIYAKKYYEKNKDKVKKRKQEYLNRPETKDKIKAWEKEYRKQLEVRARKSKYDKEYKKNHRDKINELARLRLKRPKIKEAKRESNRKRKLKKKQLFEIFSIDEWRKKTELTNDICPKCNRKFAEVFPFIVTIDHTPPISKAPVGYRYTIDDVNPLCGSCNSSKRNF